jgi:hypothetical protein
MTTGAMEGLAFVLARECVEKARGIVNRALSQADRSGETHSSQASNWSAGPPVFCTQSQVQLAAMDQSESKSTVDVMMQHNR